MAVVDFANLAWLRSQANSNAAPPEEASFGPPLEQPFVYGVLPLEPTPAGAAYEQTVYDVTPRHRRRGGT